MTNRRKCHAGDRENLALAEQAHSGQRTGTVHVALIMLVIRHLGGECPLGDARRCLVRARKAVRKFAVEAVLAPEVIVDSGLVHPCLGDDGADTGFFIAAIGKQPQDLCPRRRP